MAPLRRPQMVLCDLDGTLVDSVPDLTYCVDTMLERLGRGPRGEAAVRTWVGNGLERLVRRALVGALEGEPEASEFDRAYPIFLELYAEHTFERATLYPGVREGLDFLKAAGYPLGLVTNKAARFTGPLLRHLGLYEDFGIVISGDTLVACKPDPLPLLHAARHFGVDPTASLMIGDSVSDVRAARAAKFGIICTSYGYNHGLDIRDSAPDAVIDSLSELAGMLAAAR
ncbi:phosphoglycolate phosphatase [Marichromatium bheemlicum]|uniref:Phosphoglycolate phosphatase n=1 Tax=Marichromatium bheemlicum TaxID=365339 RepID=A0ABX1I9F0_9GAMM|nr:phosphoglycolate phosphatase [Marichromatium bheemlicum]NKN33863.1 phosphoglycolate phosphatase [Marichromatium bheemlicum]